MATPTRTKHLLPGQLGDLLVDVRSGDRGAGGPAVVVLSGFKGFKDWGMFPSLAERLARAGFTAVSYNPSGSGVDDEGRFAWPERFGHNCFSAELADLRTILDALDDGGLDLVPPSAVGLVGHSRGGGVATLETARRDRVGGLVTWGGIATTSRWSDQMRRRWREAGCLEVRNQRTGEVLPLYPDILDDIERNADALDIPAAAARIKVPWLIVHGLGDETVPVAEARALAAAAPSAELLLVERTGHTFGAEHPFAGRTAALDQVFDATLAFLTRHLE